MGGQKIVYTLYKDDVSKTDDVSYKGLDRHKKPRDDLMLQKLNKKDWKLTYPVGGNTHTCRTEEECVPDADRLDRLSFSTEITSPSGSVITIKNYRESRRLAERFIRD